MSLFVVKRARWRDSRAHPSPLRGKTIANVHTQRERERERERKKDTTGVTTRCDFRLISKEGTVLPVYVTKNGGLSRARSPASTDLGRGETLFSRRKLNWKSTRVSLDVVNIARAISVYVLRYIDLTSSNNKSTYGKLDTSTISREDEWSVGRIEALATKRENCLTLEAFHFVSRTCSCAFNYSRV